MVSASRIDGLGKVQVRIRVVSPVPQGLVQLDQDDHDEKPPSTGMKFIVQSDLFSFEEINLILPIHRVMIANRSVIFVEICVRSNLQSKNDVSLPSQTMPE